MATYVVGDLHGCFDELQSLLKLLDFDEKRDHIFFVGDLINGASKSLECLDYVKYLTTIPGNDCVLGNHDLALLAAGLGLAPAPRDRKYGIDEVLSSPKLPQYLDWLIQRPLCLDLPQFSCLLVHAGVYPTWDVATCLKLSQEVSEVLQGRDRDQFLATMRNPAPLAWEPNLTGLERIRFITNVFTQMRMLAPNYTLDYLHKNDFNLVADKRLRPWFDYVNLDKFKRTVVFGHWASLNQYQNLPHAICIDHGCVWGKTLAALRLDDHKIFQVAAE
jgi:bis(5'-nucleosyl)-tetraphosphatase (symmetrical)